MSALLRHNVNISQVLDNTGTFTAYLSCPFVPDEVKVKQLAFSCPTVPEAGVFTVRLAGLGPGGSPGGNVLGALITPCVSFSAITIPLTNFNAGTYTFGVYANDVLSDEVQDSNLNIILEFRRYRIRAPGT